VNNLKMRVLLIMKAVFDPQFYLDANQLVMAPFIFVVSFLNV